MADIKSLSCPQLLRNSAHEHQRIAISQNKLQYRIKYLVFSLDLPHISICLYYRANKTVSDDIDNDEYRMRRCYGNAS